MLVDKKLFAKIDQEILIKTSMSSSKRKPTKARCK